MNLSFTTALPTLQFAEFDTIMKADPKKFVNMLKVIDWLLKQRWKKLARS